tara:strand:+ start:42 stop:506 length:465 start_codon:yes stop_codon:yes gene_type:complete
MGKHIYLADSVWIIWSQWADIVFKSFILRTLLIFIGSIFSSDHASGTDHWMAQRLTSIAMIPLTLIFFIFFFLNYGSDYEKVRIFFAKPLINMLSIAFFAVTALHLKQGLEVVIEDYISKGINRSRLKFINSAVCMIIGSFSTLALLSLYFTAG